MIRQPHVHLTNTCRRCRQIFFHSMCMYTRRFPNILTFSLLKYQLTRSLLSLYHNCLLERYTYILYFIQLISFDRMLERPKHFSLVIMVASTFRVCTITHPSEDNNYFDYISMCMQPAWSTTTCKHAAGYSFFTRKLNSWKHVRTHIINRWERERRIQISFD